MTLESAPAPSSAARTQLEHIEVAIAREAAPCQPSEEQHSSQEGENLAAAVQALAEGGGPSLSLW